LFHNYHP